MGIYTTTEEYMQQSLRDLNNLEDEIDKSIFSEVCVLWGTALEHDERFDTHTLGRMIDMYSPVLNLGKSLLDLELIQYLLSSLNTLKMPYSVKRTFILRLKGYLAYVSHISFDDIDNCKFYLATIDKRYVMAFC